ncbi:hypothetical protein PIGHUM_02479 [Pigmentiphaga humi]|uniref:Nickel/cobalt homeostasis protein RcnB n=2 Tax=Pigmentiphaga humi TaxID=2478468 RepID=A0A3P4B292_9BURK|nr:hypothetical protein PIGHUM_02479 [Pigmentiphaga humi]
MKTRRLLTSIVLGAFVAVSGTAMAQGGPGRGNGPDRGASHGGPGGGPHGGPGAGGGAPGHNGPGMRPGNRPHAGPPGQANYRPDPRYERWAKGQRVPLPYRGPQYVVDNWRGHHLAPPPRGYHWINVGADYFLVGVATGIVLQAIFGQ